MEILKICAIGLITAFCVVALKEQKSEIAMLIAIAGGCIILVMLLDGVTEIFSVLSSLIARTGIPPQLFSLIVKIIGIGYITEFSAGIIEDSGQKSLADKVVLGGKVVIMGLSLPIVIMLFDTIAGVLK